MVSLLRQNGRKQVKRARKRTTSSRLLRALLIAVLLLPLALSVYRISVTFTKLPSKINDLVPSQKEDCADCGTGTCLVNRCICVDPASTGAHCDQPSRNHNAHSIACFKGNDDRCMNIPNYGRLKALSNTDRTTAARKCEVSWWENAPQGRPIRNEQQLVAFDDFETLPEDLGDVLELGAGPYTKFRLILEQAAGERRRVNSITLVDPLLDEYLSNANITTSYNKKELCVKDKCTPVMLLSMTGEALASERRGLYDTVILVNTLEHTENAVQILHNIYTLLKPRGILVFGEEFATLFQLQIADPCHPIRIQRQLFDEYLSLFGETLMAPKTGMNMAGITHEGVKQSVYAIVRK